MFNVSYYNSAAIRRTAAIGLYLSLVLLALPPFAFSQAVLNPNQIRGQIGFSNQNADVLRIANEGGPSGTAYVSADSIEVQPALRNWSYNFYNNALPFDYELTVESSTAGISYNVGNELFAGRYRYKFKKVRSAGVTPEPATDTQVNLNECVSIARINWVDRSGAPALIDGGQVIVWEPVDGELGWYLDWHAINYYFRQAVSSDYVPVRGDGTTFRLDVTYQRGTDEYSNRVSYTCTKYLTGTCDQIVDATCVVPDPISLGKITGTLDMVGETELPTYHLSVMRAWDGPHQNYRLRHLDGRPASGVFALENLLPSSTTDSDRPGYIVYGEMLFREGRRVEYFQTPALGYLWNDRVAVAPGETKDLGETFVMRPGTIKGRVEFAGPKIDQGSSCLAYMYRDSDERDQNGVPYNYFISRSFVGAYGAYNYDGGSVGAGGAARVEFEGEYNRESGAFAGDYQMMLAGLNGAGSVWVPNTLGMTFYNRSAYSDGSGFYYSMFYLDDARIGGKLVEPGKEQELERSYCMSEVKVTYRSLGSTFYLPEATVTGEFDGTDYKGRNGRYHVSYGLSYGFPMGSHEASTNGVVTLCLPQGSYQIVPAVHSNSANGASLKTELRTIKLDVGCGQRIEVTTDLQVALGSLPAETAEFLTVYGAGHSSGNVEDVHYALNDGPPQALCTNCGTDPRFSFEPELLPGSNKIVVTARDASGASASMTAHISYRPQVTLLNCIDKVGTLGQPVAFNVTAQGGCGGELAVSCDHESGIEYPAGVTPVICNVSDICGASDQCEFEVKIPTDDEPNACDNGKVLLCHIPPGCADAAHSIRVGLSAVAAHLAHGDTLGLCPGDGSGDTQDDGAAEARRCRRDGLEICHMPPGNQENAHTLTIGWSAVRAHLEHGDSLGECLSGGDSASSSSSSGGPGDPASFNRDSDGDGVSDGVELDDGTNPDDRGSFRTRLRSPVYSLWNRALDMLNILELVNPNATPVTVQLSLFGFNGDLLHSRQVPIGAFGEQDVIVNDLPGFAQSPYGLVKVEFGSPVDGRMFYYRRTDSLNYDYAFNSPFENPSTGATGVTFNTFQPSGKPDEQQNVVANWLSIVNLEPAGRRFTVKSYRQSGELFQTRVVYVPGYGRADVDGGHVMAGAGVVGLHEVIPDDSLPYISQLMRYGSNAAPGGVPTRYDFAFALAGRPGNGSRMAAPLSRKFGEDNWLELANTSAEPIEVQVKLYKESGIQAYSSALVLSPHSQQHISPALLGALSEGESGTALITPSKRNSLAAQSMFYFKRSDNGIAAMYGSQAGESFGGAALSGSYNRFLGMENWLKVFNTESAPATVTLKVNGNGAELVRQIEIAAHATENLPLHDGAAFGTTADTYGVAAVSAATPAKLFSEVIRIRPETVPGLGVDFASATRTR